MYTFAGNVGFLYAEADDISPLELSIGTTRAALRPVNKSLQSLRKPKACVSSRTAGKTEQRCVYKVKYNTQIKKYAQ